MSKFRFDISQTGRDTIRIEADNGIFIDDWRELSGATCLIGSGGGFTINANESVFKSGGILNFRLLGKPFEADVDHTGDAYIELAEPGCPNDGWMWRLVSKS